MKGQATIDGRDIWEEYGASLVKGAYAALLKPPAAKECVSNTSRLEHGKRVVLIGTQKMESREVSFSFVVEGGTEAELASRFSLLLKDITGGAIKLGVPRLGRSFTLLYKSAEEVKAYRTRFIRVLKVTFEEPDPSKTE